MALIHHLENKNNENAKRTPWFRCGSLCFWKRASVNVLNLLNNMEKSPFDAYISSLGDCSRRKQPSPMQWTDEGIVLGVRKHGESSVILELMTYDHGRHLGLVHGGRSRTRQPMLQPGNTVSVTWRARLDEHLGTFQVEPATSRAARFMGSPMALYGLATLAHLLRHLPERDPHPALYETLTDLLEHLDDPDLAPALFVRFELTMLAELGFGLDLTSCAATGSQNDLAYVSPRSGRAVSAAAGEPYKDRLLKLPGFLIGQSRANRPRDEEVRDGFALTDFFLHQNVFDPQGKGAPEERARFVALATAGDD